MSDKKCEISEDVNGLLRWIECFNIYSSVLLPKRPSLGKPLTAYAIMMVKEGPAIRVQGMAAVRPAILPTCSKRTNCSALGKTELSALHHFLFKPPKRGDSDHPNFGSPGHSLCTGMPRWGLQPQFSWSAAWIYRPARLYWHRQTFPKASLATPPPQTAQSS